MLVCILFVLLVTVMAYMSAVQWYLTLLNFLFIFFLGTVTYSPILTLFTPDHFCRVEELQNMTREARRSLAIPRHPDTGRYAIHDGYCSRQHHCIITHC